MHRKARVFYFYRIKPMQWEAMIGFRYELATVVLQSWFFIRRML